MISRTAWCWTWTDSCGPWSGSSITSPAKATPWYAPSSSMCSPARLSTRPSTADTKVDTANVDRRDMQYLYHDGSGFVFMDTSTYDQLTIPDETVGDAKNYLLEEQVATVAMHDGNPLYLELPASVELVITYTEPGLQGDRSTGGTKPATVETGLQIQVPLFLTTGEKVKVDTRTW